MSYNFMHDFSQLTNPPLIRIIQSQVFFGKMIALLKAGAITGPWCFGPKPKRC
jgi:hypothetical protein